MVAKNQVASSKTDSKPKADEPKQVESEAKVENKTSSKPSESNSRTADNGNSNTNGDITVVDVDEEPNHTEEQTNAETDEDGQLIMPWGYQFFHLWLPRLHLVSAWTLLIMNLIVPGLGTILFSFKWLGFADYAFDAPMSVRCRIFSISLACGIAQLVFTPIIVGWGFAVLTGLMAVKQAQWIMAIEEEEEEWYQSNYGQYQDEDMPEGYADSDEAKRKRHEMMAQRDLPGRLHGPKRVYKAPPGWVYRLYPGFINQPNQNDEEQQATASTSNNNSDSSNENRNKLGTAGASTSKAKTPKAKTPKVAKNEAAKKEETV